MLSAAEAAELLSFLTPGTRPDVKGHATQYLLGLSGDAEGRHYLRTQPPFLRALLLLTSDLSIAVAKDCCHALINLSADPTLHRPLVHDARVLPTLLQNLLDPEFMFSDRISTILTNLSRHHKTCKEVLQAMQAQTQTQDQDQTQDQTQDQETDQLKQAQQPSMGLAKLVEIFCTEGYNQNASLNYLGPFLSNLSQLPEARHFLLDHDRCVVQRLLPYTRYEASTVRRGGVVGTLRNCCFDHAHHEWLLSDAVDILPFLLLPLAGPEELTEEENEGLPVDVQFLPEDKKREEDPDIRKMLVETLILLTATRPGRQALRQRSTYPIIRDLHRWETDPGVASACEKLVQALIGDEPESGMENLMELDIPEEVEENLKDMDAKEQEELEKERERLIKQEEEKERERLIKQEEEGKEEEQKRRPEVLGR